MFGRTFQRLIFKRFEFLFVTSLIFPKHTGFKVGGDCWIIFMCGLLLSTLFRLQQFFFAEKYNHLKFWLELKVIPIWSWMEKFFKICTVLHKIAKDIPRLYRPLFLHPPCINKFVEIRKANHGMVAMEIVVCSIPESFVIGNSLFSYHLSSS